MGLKFSDALRLSWSNIAEHKKTAGKFLGFQILLNRFDIHSRLLF